MKSAGFPLIVFAATVLSLPGYALAHGGPLDENGCHVHPKSGRYHCHGKTRPSTSPPRSSTSRTFRSCSEARAAGAAPIRRGSPGYSKGLDRDGDGIACE